MAGSSGSADNARELRQAQSAYPISRSYSPPSMQPTYTYSPSAGQGVDPYRASQSGSHASSLPSINLPPIRSIDAQSQPPVVPAGAAQYQPQLPQQASPILQQQSLPQYPLPGPMTSYYPPPPPAPHGMPTPAHQLGFGAPAQPSNTLYRLPPQLPDQRVMSGGRHKKEIKRRTKTGCLTCRKRRIKCDEAHPTCRNCQKSKRECLGYDPIFKQQSSPPPLHPAPNPLPEAEPSSETARKRTSQWVTAPLSYTTSSKQGYSLPQSGGQPSHSYDFRPDIDPTLGPDAEGMLHSQAAQEGPTDARNNRRQSLYDTAYPRKRARIDDLFCINGHAPPLPHIPPAPLPPARVDEVRLVFTRDYAPGLDKVLETDWYSKRSWPTLIQHQRLLSLFDQMLDRFKTIRSDDFNGNQLTRSMETMVVWEILSMIRSPYAAPDDSGGPMTEDIHQLREAQTRLDALEALLTNSILVRNPTQDVRYDYQLHNTKQWEIDFWRLLGQFVAPTPIANTTDTPLPPQQPTTEDTLLACRNILAMLENRDVLYSVMICRYYGPKLPGWPDVTGEPYSNNPEDARNKVFIARKFIEDEAGGKGTNQVIQRICDMSIRAWHVTR